MTDLKELINDICFVDMSKRIGELEAKVYTYEKIIANSNFAPMIQPTIVETVTEFPKGEKGTE